MNIKLLAVVIVAFGMGAVFSLFLQTGKEQPGQSVLRKQPLYQDPLAALEPQNRFEALEPEEDFHTDLIAVPKGYAEAQVVKEVTPTSEQIMRYENALLMLRDPSHHTLAELGLEAQKLSPDLTQKFQDEFKRLEASGELSLLDFKRPELPRHQTVAEGAPPPTQDEQARYEQLVASLYDPVYTENLTIIEFAIKLQKQNLPPSLKQEITDKLGELISQGVLKPEVLLMNSKAGLPARLSGSSVQNRFFFP